MPEPVTLAQIFSAVQGLRADVRALDGRVAALDATVQQFKVALVNQGNEISRISARQIEEASDTRERLRALEHPAHAEAGIPNGGG